MSFLSLANNQNVSFRVVHQDSKQTFSYLNLYDVVIVIFKILWIANEY